MKSNALTIAILGFTSACTLVPAARQVAGPAPEREGHPPPRSSNSSGELPPLTTLGAQCTASLTEVGAQFVTVADVIHGDGCSTVGTIQLSSLASDRARISLGGMGPMQCSLASAFAAWARFGVDRAARQLLGSGVQRIETFGSYSCRNVAGTRHRSGHATAAAVDISGFILTDGRRITVEQAWNNGTTQEKQFLRTVLRSACRRFGTVLGPDYNAAHHDHFHLEAVIEDSSFCR